MAYENLTVEKSGNGVALLTINRPEALNSLNDKLLGSLEQALKDLDKDDALRTLIVTGAGEKAFVAGADIESMKGYNESQGLAFSELGHKVMNALAGFPRPTIAAVNGFALGGGCELALACDIVIASEKAKLGLPEVGLGLIPGWGGTQRLARRVGPGKAKELIFSGEHVRADEAHRIGLVDRVVAPDKLLEEARKLAETIASRGPEAVRAAKQAIEDGMRRGLVEGLEMEKRLFARCFVTEDTPEGIGAFLEKRKPNFKGR